MIDGADPATLDDDPSTHATSVSVTLPAPMNAVAVNPKNNEVYVATTSGVTILDGHTNNTVNDSPIAACTIVPTAILFDQKTNLAYCQASNNSLSTINMDSHAVGSLQVRADGVVNGISAMALSESAGTKGKIFFIVTTSENGDTGVLDLATGAFSFHVADLAPQPFFTDMAVNTSTNKVYYFGNNQDPSFGYQSATVGRYDDPGNTASTAATITGKPPGYVDVVAGKVIVTNPNTNRVYVLQRAQFDFEPPYMPPANGGIAVMDGDVMVPTTVATGTTYSAIAVNTKTNKVYAVGQQSSTVTVLK